MSSPGTVVTYTFTGQNTGTVSLHNVVVTDPMSGLSSITCTPGAPATLAAGDSISCSASYTVTQANVDAGSIDNTATIDALDPADNPVSQTADATVTADQQYDASVTKTASPDSGVVAGDIVTYTVTTTNTGTVTLTAAVTEHHSPACPRRAARPACPPTSAPVRGVTCTATYTVTQADVDAGSIANTASVTLDSGHAGAT